MDEQEGIANRHPSVCISDPTLIPRVERTHRNLHSIPHPSGHRPRHLESWTSLRRPQETSLPLHRGQHLLSTFHRPHARHCRGSGRTWCLVIRNPCQRHPRAVTLGSSSHRFLRVDLAPKHRRKTFAVDTLTSSSNQLRRHLHHHHRLLHFR
jgi:hypothetical protein